MCEFRCKGHCKRVWIRLISQSDQTPFYDNFSQEIRRTPYKQPRNVRTLLSDLVCDNWENKTNHITGISARSSSRVLKPMPRFQTSINGRFCIDIKWIWNIDSRKNQYDTCIILYPINPWGNNLTSKTNMSPILNQIVTQPTWTRLFLNQLYRTLGQR